MLAAPGVMAPTLRLRNMPAKCGCVTSRRKPWGLDTSRKHVDGIFFIVEPVAQSWGNHDESTSAGQTEQRANDIAGGTTWQVQKVCTAVA